MTSARVVLSAPDVGELEERFVVDAMRSGWVAPLGPHVDAFEAEVAQRCGRRFGVALSSGTAALHLGLLELGAGPGSAVVVPTMTFAATANAAVYAGATPVFVDCDDETGNVDPGLLARALACLRAEGVRVSAAVPVDLLGRCVDYERVLGVCDRFDVPVLEDAAESLGSSRHGSPAGSFGAASVLSFNGNKILTTSGGGMLLTDDARLAARVRHLSAQARQPVAHYEHAEIGYSYRLSNLLAALGRGQLQRLDAMTARRRALRATYDALFCDVEGVTLFQRAQDDEDNCWLTAVLVDEDVTGWSAVDLAKSLEAENVESRPLWKPLHLQPVFSGARAFLTGSAERLFRQGLALPSGSGLQSDEIGRVVGAIDEFLARQR